MKDINVLPLFNVNMLITYVYISIGKEFHSNFHLLFVYLL